MYCRLGLRLLRLFATGVLAGTEVQLIAMEAWADGQGGSSLLRRLAKAGTCGRHTGNITRDLIKAIMAEGIMAGTAEPYDFKVPGPDGKSSVVSCFLPHEVYHKLVQERGVEAFVVGPDRENDSHGIPSLLRTWCSHPDVTMAHQARDVAAIGMHGDAVQYTASQRAGDQKSVTAVSFNFISAREVSDRGHRHLFAVLSKGRQCNCGCSAYHSFQAMFEVFSWSMMCLMLGISPSCRHDGGDWTASDRGARLPNGTPLPAAALVQLRGDWDWYSAAFRMRMAGAEHFCWMCNSTRSAGSFCYKDFTPGAVHRGTMVTHQAYVTECMQMNQPLSSIFSSPGFTVAGLAVDCMHSGDLGVFADIAGSILWFEVTSKQYYRNNVVGLRSLNQQLDRYFQGAASSTIAPLTGIALTQIRGKVPGYPFLKAKAAQVRHVAPFLQTLTRRHLHGDALRPPLQFKAGHRMAPHNRRHAELAVAAADGIVDFLESCRQEPFNEGRCKAAMYVILSTLKTLSEMWRVGVPEPDHGPLPWHIRPKCHLLQHMIEDQLQSFGSPAAFHCYADEDFVGGIKRVCQKTKHPATLERRVAEKARVLASVDAIYLRHPEMLGVPATLL